MFPNARMHRYSQHYFLHHKFSPSVKINEEKKKKILPHKHSTPPGQNLKLSVWLASHKMRITALYLAHSELSNMREARREGNY